MWQGHLMFKNDSAAVQLHFLSGNVSLAKLSLPQSSDQRTPSLRIAQRMRLEQTQLEGVERRIHNEKEHCLLLALPCGRDANDVRAQTHALKNKLISRNRLQESSTYRDPRDWLCPPHLPSLSLLMSRTRPAQQRFRQLSPSS